MKQYDDIVVGHFEDNYENLPTKTKFVYKTAVDLCHSEVDSYYMIDSDVLLGNVLIELVKRTIEKIHIDYQFQVMQNRNMEKLILSTI